MSARDGDSPGVAADELLTADALETETATPGEAAAPARPTPAFRRFSAGSARGPATAEEPPPILPDIDRAPPPEFETAVAGVAAPEFEPGPPAPGSAPLAPEPVAVSPPPEPIGELTKPSWGVETAAAPPLPVRAPAAEPAPGPPLSDADRSAAALRKVEAADAFLLPARDPQADLDGSVGCGEWFDRRPVKRATPARIEATPAVAPDASPALDRPHHRPATGEARTEFGGGDIGAGGDRLAAILAYLLLMVGAPTLGLGLAGALFLSWRFIEQGADDWKRTHYRYQFRTAVIGLAAGFVAGLLQFVDYVGVLAVPFLMLLVGWLTLRAAVGLHHLFQGRAHPNYRTWVV